MSDGLGLWTRQLLHGLGRCFGVLEGRCRVCAELRPQAERGLFPGDDWRRVLARHLCLDCAEELAPRLRGFCPKCGELYPATTSPPHLCAACLSDRARSAPAWDRLYFYSAYRGALRRLLLRYKFQDALGLGALLEDLACLAFAMRTPEGEPWPELIAPTPLHRRRLIQRGYNQSLELSRALSRRLGVPLAPQAMRRTRRTRPQHTLNREERAQNLANALLADPRLVEGRRVLLVDDIMTSGATLREATRALLAAGAAQVSALVVARAPGRD